MAHHPADARLRAKIYFVKGMQQPEGNWRGGGSRPPLTFDDFTTTAYMIHALNTYAAPAEAADTASRIDCARTWLLNARAERTQERAFQLLGLMPRWQYPLRLNPLRSLAGNRKSCPARRLPDRLSHSGDRPVSHRAGTAWRLKTTVPEPPNRCSTL